MDIATQIINFFGSIPAEFYVFVLGAAGVSALTQVLKKTFSLESEKVVTILFAGVSFIAGGFDYLLSAHNLPPMVLGVNMVTIMGIATPMYRFVIKPLDTFLGNYKKYRSQLMKEVETLDAVATTVPGSKVVETPTAQVVVAPIPDASVEDKTPPIANF